MKKFKVGIYIGRFQPPHNGHIHAIKYALENVGELIIAIGSAQYSHDPENPFTAGERMSMLRSALDEAGVDRGRYCILPVPDTTFHSIWVAQILSYTPRFEVVFTNDALTMRLLKEAGFHVERIPFFNRTKYNATAVRNKILNGESWEDVVPPAVAKFIKKIGGIDRIRELAKTDKPST